MTRDSIWRWRIVAFFLASAPFAVCAQSPGRLQPPVDAQSAPNERPATNAPPRSASPYDRSSPDRDAQNNRPPQRPAADKNPGEKSAPSKTGADKNASDPKAGAAQPQAPPPPKSPFDLTEAEAKNLDDVLKAWEDKNNGVKNFRCKFELYLYDPTFGPAVKNALNGLQAQAAGEIKYKAPDHGAYQETERKEFQPPVGPNAIPVAKMGVAQLQALFKPVTRMLDHWVCDGKAVYTFEIHDGKDAKNVLRVTPLPKEMQGQAIADGPLPFIFGAKADKLKKRYWIRVSTPQGVPAGQVWLEAYPKYLADAGNFQSVVIILNTPKYEPVAMQITLPGGKSRKSYMFSDVKINDMLWKILADFDEPSTPFGWTRVVEKPPTDDAPPAGPPPAAANGQAKRPQAGPPRK